MSIKLLPYLLLMTVFETACATPAQEVERFSFNSLEKAVFSTLEKSLANEPADTDPGGLIIVLGEIDSEYTRATLLRLANVYLGSANSEAFQYAVSQQGKLLLGGLRELLGSPVNCEFLRQGSNLRCLERESRNRQIRRLIKIIENGEKIEYLL